jgi:two-component system response regulator AtoC
MIYRILIIDDEEYLCKNLEEALAEDGYKVFTAHTGIDGIETAEKESPDLILLDLKLPDKEGIEVLKNLDSLDYLPITIMMTAHGNIEAAVQAIKVGAYDFLEKPFPVDKLKVIVRNALYAKELRNNLNTSIKIEKRKFGFHNLIGKSQAIKEIISLIEKLVATDPKTILITGETGTGKGLVAKLLHYNGVRADKPFLELNCASIPETLLESELFGHEAGSFTDAKKMKKGIFEEAHGGTIFLDEIGDMSQTLQAKLVKVVEERTFRRIGGARDITVDVRVIAATNRDLRELVRQNLFREDLFHRLNVINFEMPSLRKRREDIPLIVEYFLNDFNSELNKNIKKISDDTMRALTHYGWPGNVRELRSTIERAVILSEGDELSPSYIQLEENDGDNVVNIENDDRKLFLEIDLDNASLGGIEDKIIKRALEVNQWNQTKASKMLGITRHTLRNKMKRMGMLE